jgi:hypothetical protein
MKRNKFLAVLVCVFLALSAAGPVLAGQEAAGLQLNLIRNFGYGGFTKIQGDFTLRISNPPADLKEASFFVDGELLATVSSAPYQTKFRTADYSPGQHRLSAKGVLEDGSRLESNAITKTFLSGEEAWSETSSILVPLLVGVGVLTLLGLGVPLVLSRKKDFVLGQYGPAGGVVCPRCGLPFSRSALAPNLLVGKLVRCPHCGKVSVLARAAPDRLAEAERKYSDTQGTSSLQQTKTEELQRMLDDSRFEE